MPILESEVPYTHGQKIRRWVAAAIVLCAGVGFAIWAAFDCAQIRFGYAAGYSYGAVFFIALGLFLLGFPPIIYWRTRSTGAAIMATAVLVYATFVGCMSILKKLDRVAWMHEPPEQRFGPDQVASLVIYYRPGTADNQIEDFVEHKLENYPSKVHDGTDFPAFVTEYSALTPDQANGFNGSALIFRANAQGPDVDAFVATVQSNPRVARVFRNTAPDAIHLPKSQQASRAAARTR